MLKSIIKNHTLLVILILSFILAIYRVWEPAVIFTDELFIEDISRAMAEGGSWIIPKIDGIPYLAKPPLLYWITAPALSAGIAELSSAPSVWLLRLPMVTTGILLAWVTYALTTLWFSRKAALWATLFLVTGAPYIYFTKTANWDILNTFLCALLFYLYNLRHKKWVYFYFVSITLGLSVLNRSYLGLIPLAAITMEHLVFPTRKLPVNHFIWGIILFFSIILPWHIFAYVEAPKEFVNDYLSLVFPFHTAGLVPGDESTSPLFYLSLFFFFPPAIFGIIQLIKLFKQKLSPTTIQLAGWIIIPFIVLTISQTRHEWYALPLIVPFSILAGVFVEAQIKGKTSIQRSLVIFISIACIITGPLALLTQPLPEAPIITIVNDFKIQHHNTPLYQWRYPLIPTTRYYPKIQVHTLSSKAEITSPLYMIIRQDDAYDFLNTFNTKVVTETDTLYLLHISP